MALKGTDKKIYQREYMHVRRQEEAFKERVGVKQLDWEVLAEARARALRARVYARMFPERVHGSDRIRCNVEFQYWDALKWMRGRVVHQRETHLVRNGNE